MSVSHHLSIPSDRALDVSVAERVLCFRWYVSKATGRRALFMPGSQPGWFVESVHGDEPLASDWDTSVERYSTDIDAAFRVVEKVKNRVFALTWNTRPPVEKGPIWTACFQERFYESGETAPIAICRAALAWSRGGAGD